MEQSKCDYVVPEVTVIDIGDSSILTVSGPDCYYDQGNYGSHAYQGCQEESGWSNAGWIDNNEDLNP